MNKQTIAVIMAVLVGSAGIANAGTVTPPPAIAKAMASVTHQYCQAVATNTRGYVMQKRLSVLGIKTQVRTGISWPLVLNFKETCAPTKKDLHLYQQAQEPMVKMVRDRFNVPVWNIKEAYLFCVKHEKGKHEKVTGILNVIENCLAPTKK